MITENLITVASFTPKSLHFPNSWLGHLPFAAWIIQEVSPKIFVELGTHTGNSYFSFCQAVLESSLSTKCYAVDTWQGDEHAGQYSDEVFRKVNAYDQENYSGFSRLLRMTFDDATAYFSDGSIDLMHIDGFHTYDAVRHDFETWLPKLARGAVVIFHDTNVHERNFGVWKLWKELQKQYSNHLEFFHSNGLGVLQLNNALNDKKIKWLRPEASDKKRLVKYFASLGARQEERFNIIELNGHISNLNQVIGEHNRQLANLNQEILKVTEQTVVLNKVISDRDIQILTLNQIVVERDRNIMILNQNISQQHGKIHILEHNKSEQERKIHQIHCSITQNTVINLGRKLSRLGYIRKSEYMRLKREIIKQPLFDFNWYADNNPQLKKSNATLLHHYYYFGIEEGINPGPYFHNQWYLDEYSDVAKSGVNPLLHYLIHGVAEGRNPNPYFDTGWYLKEYPDVVHSRINPLLHYIKHGENEGRNPGPYFDTNWYLEEYPDVAESGMKPLLHYMKYGVEEGRSPNPYFDTRWYKNEYKNDSMSGINPLLHYLEYGVKEGKNPNPFFDTDWYLNEYPDVIGSGMNPLLHYLTYGIKEGRNTNAFFDTRWYLNEYPDVAHSDVNPLLHYMRFGVEEEINPAPCFDTRWYLTEYPDVAHCGMHPLHHYLKFGSKEGRKPIPVRTIPGFERARDGGPSSDHFMLHSHSITSELIYFDVIIVTYNSSIWVDKCLLSLLNHDRNIRITIVDNASTDDTVARLDLYKNMFSHLNIVKNTSNTGFGAANNLGAQVSSGKYLIFINIDTELHDTETFSRLCKIIARSKSDIAAWEFRQLPYEHPKCYDPVSLETSWFSGAAVAIKREAFVEVSGFDEKLFMYCEDVDLSWRIRAKGYRILYCPSVTIVHHCYSRPGEIKPIAQLYGVKHNYFLRCRYGTEQNIREGAELLKQFARDSKENLSSALFEKLKYVEDESTYFKQTRCESNQFFKPYFEHYEYEIAREGSFYHTTVSQQTEKVSIIIRTIGRLHYLERAIYSVINQTYRNIEIIIVEDGSSKAKKLVSKFNDFNVVYESSEKLGRCRVGNKGLQLATGSFYNFLDEDDLLYCDHIETLMNAISGLPAYGAVWSSAFCVTTEETKNRQNYTEINYELAHTSEPDTESIIHYNYFPIQAVLFRRACYETLGGFDPEMDLLEDWDLWIRYLKKYNFKRVEKTTSLYRVPFDKTVSEERKKNLHQYYERVKMKNRGEQPLSLQNV